MRPSELSVGVQLGSWVLEQRVHQGNQTEIWRAQGTTGPVALKLATSDDWSEVLDREAALLCEAQLPGVVRFLEADAGGFWLAMSWVDGQKSSEWAQGQPLSELALLFERLSYTLSDLHGRGLVHGDLAPANILVHGSSEPQLIDFGLGVGLDPIPERIGLHGTPGYVAPELLSGGIPTAASDVYAMGALAYRLLTGRHPFAEVALHALQLQAKLDLPAPPSSLRPEIPLELDALILTMLSRDPGRRPSSGHAGALWREMAARRPARPIAGNLVLRSNLRVAVARALDGEPTQVLLYGPTGSGRATLIHEACRHAELEGLHPVFMDVSDAKDEEDLRHTLTETLSGTAGLTLIRARHAIPSLEARGVLHLRTSPLRLDDVVQLMTVTGQDSTKAPEIHAHTAGHPASVWAHLGFPDEVPDLSPPARALLELLAQGPLSIEAIGLRVEMSPHEVLDLAEPLLNQGALIELDEGTQLGLPSRTT